MKNKQPTVICLMGPTASGKTDLALQLVDHLPCEIISVDSALVYRGMSIGTAKPEKEILECVPHHLIDIRDPWQAYSAAEFREDAIACIEAIFSRQKIPLLVGGTMLYFKVLQQGISLLPSADPVIRETLAQQAAQHGWQAMHARLEKIDPQSAARIKPTDQQRIQRALEVYEITGSSLSQLWAADAKNALPYHFVNIGLLPDDRAILHDRIAQRFDNMLATGFLEEAKALYDNPKLSVNDPAIRSVGYRQAWSYFAGDYDQATFREKAIIATRQLAKRQITWLRSWPDLIELNCQQAGLYQPLLQVLQDRI